MATAMKARVAARANVPARARTFRGRRASSVGRTGNVTKRQTMTMAGPNLAISVATMGSLFLGRFVFLPYQRENMEKQVPKQNNQTYVEAGDTRAKEASGMLKSNDPAGFNIVDVLAWGAIGHIVGFAALVAQRTLAP